MSPAFIHVVDDDESLRTALLRLLEAMGHQARGYANTGEFLLNLPEDRHGCVLLDVQLPGPSGLELQAALGSKGIALPVIVMTGHPDVAASVRAMKAGTNQGIEVLASDQGTLWDIAVDDTHVYWTSVSNGTLARVPLEGGPEPEILADTASPWGLDLGCHAAFWAENGTQTLQRALK